VGSKPAALPAWLCVVPGPRGGRPAGGRPTDGRPGSEPTGSGEVIVIGGCGGSGASGCGACDGVAGAVCVVDAVLGAVMATDADTLAALGSEGAVPVTVRLTDLTAEAATGTVSCACSCRCADCGSTAPRSQDDVPSDLPQPKLKLAVPLPAGLACSVRVAPVAVAPVVQALTVQPTCLPRSLLACAAATSTQRAAGLALGVVLGVVDGSAGVDGTAGVDGSAVVVGAGPVGVGVALGEVAESVGLARFDVFVVLEGLAVAVLDVAAVEGCVVAECVGVADVLCVGVRSGAVLGVAVGVGAVVVVGGAGEVEVGVGVAEALGDGAGNCSDSHDCLPPGAAAVVAAAVAAAVAATAGLTPETAVSRTLPVTRATAAGRGCANRMKTPTDAARYCSERLTWLRHSLPG
jgi:hypothetical protein